MKATIHPTLTYNRQCEVCERLFFSSGIIRSGHITIICGDCKDEK